MEQGRDEERELYGQVVEAAAEQVMHAAITIIKCQGCRAIESEIDIKMPGGRADIWRVRIERLGDGGTT